MPRRLPPRRSRDLSPEHLDFVLSRLGGREAGSETRYAPACRDRTVDEQPDLLPLPRPWRRAVTSISRSGPGERSSRGSAEEADANAMALQRDGKIVTAGDAVVRGVVRFALARYRTDGTLDPSFGGNGKVTTRIGPSVDVATSVAIQRDGRIVAAGASSTGTGYDFALARYDSTGRLDPTFGVKGRVTTDFGHGEDVAFDLAILPDGRVVVCGLAATTGNDAFALARYRPDGTLDPTFGRHGKKITTFPDNAEATGLAIQSDGKIVVAGSNGDQEYYSQFALARYRPNGALDLTFGQGGRVLTDLGGFGVASDLALQPDGKLVVAGATRRRFALAR